MSRRTKIPTGYSRVRSQDPAFRWLKSNHLDKSHSFEVRIGYGPQLLYYWPDTLIAQAPAPDSKRQAAAAKAVNTKAERMEEWARTVAIEIEAPVSLAKLAKAAIDHRNNFMGPHQRERERRDCELRARHGDWNGSDDAPSYHDASYYPGCESDEHVYR